MGRGAGYNYGFGKNATPLQKAAGKMHKEFFSQGTIDYFNGSNSQQAAKANAKYEKAKEAFAKEWDKVYGKPAFDDYSSAMLDIWSGRAG